MTPSEVEEALASLEKQGLMKHNDDGTWTPTDLGRLVVQMESGNGKTS